MEELARISLRPDDGQPEMMRRMMEHMRMGMMRGMEDSEEAQARLQAALRSLGNPREIVREGAKAAIIEPMMR
jgi:hypothetical protein